MPTRVTKDPRTKNSRMGAPTGMGNKGLRNNSWYDELS
jgi:hypothetical protein